MTERAVPKQDKGPLVGFRVLDLTNVLAGPFCTYQLVLLGAEVIKIETPDGGDLARQLGADPERSRALMGASFLAQNAEKKSVALDLKYEDGKAAFLRACADSRCGRRELPPGRDGSLGARL